MKLTRVSNAGILVERNRQKILIDGFNSAGVYHYFGTNPDTFAHLCAQVPMDYLLFTHSHDDHFNAVMTMQYLERHDLTKVVAPHTTLEKLQLCGISPERLIAAEDLPLGTDFPVNAFPTVHISAPYRNVVHYSYYLPGEESLLHTGDAIPLKSNYTAFAASGANVSVLAGNYAHIIGAGVRIIRDIIRPNATVVLHLPDPNHDEEHLYQLTRDSVQKNADLSIRLLEMNDTVTY